MRLAAPLEPKGSDVRRLLAALAVWLLEHFALRGNQAKFQLAIGVCELDDIEAVCMHRLNTPWIGFLPLFEAEVDGIAGLLGT